MAYIGREPNVQGESVYETYVNATIAEGNTPLSEIDWIDTLGSLFIKGSGAPSNAVGVEGSFFADSTNNRLYGPKGASTWDLTAETAGNPDGYVTWNSGEKGDKGDDGDDGSSGSSAFAIAVGQGFSGSESEWLVSLNGTPMLNGTSDPLNRDTTADPVTEGTGTDGDFFIRTDTNFIFGPKAAGVWPEGVDLNGEAVTGVDGSSSTEVQFSNSLGNIGSPIDLKGDTGDTGPIRGVGTTTPSTVTVGGSATATVTANGDNMDFAFGLPTGATGATGASPVFNTTVTVTDVAENGTATASINNTNPLVPALSLGVVTGDTGNLDRDVTIYKNGTSAPTTPTTTNTILNNDLTGFSENTQSWSLAPSTPGAGEFTFVSGAVHRQVKSTGSFTIVDSSFRSPSRISGEKGDTGAIRGVDQTTVTAVAAGGTPTATVTADGDNMDFAFGLVTGNLGPVRGVGTTTTSGIAPGGSATATVTADGDNMNFTFGIPTGATGPAGSIAKWVTLTAYSPGALVLSDDRLWESNDAILVTNAVAPEDNTGATGATWRELSLSITSAQASAITANTAKVGITTAQASAITANTAKTGITATQASAITTNTAKTGITATQASAITTNTAKVGITTAQASAITANSAKTGITSGQASAITANTAKTGITATQASAITANSAKVGITTGQASAITANSAKVGITTTQASAITANSAKVGITTTQASAITVNSSAVASLGTAANVNTGTASGNVPVLDSNGKLAAGVIDAVNLSDVESFTTKALRNSSTATVWHRGDIAIITAGDDLGTYLYTGTDQTTAAATADGNWTALLLPTGFSGAYGDLTGTPTTITSGQASAITANSAKTGITTTQASAITANSAKVGITTTQASAITANSAKVGITTTQASAITANSAKVGITTGQASAITANSAKTGITSGQASAITANSAKVGITTAQASAITANTAKVGITSGQVTQLGNLPSDIDVVVNSSTHTSNLTFTVTGTTLAITSS